MTRWTQADLVAINLRLNRQIEQPLAPASKFGNQPIEVDGLKFDSKLEARRYPELKLLEQAGQISELEFHKCWPLTVKGVKLGYYESDFSYIEDGLPVIEDCKGFPTPMYRWKKKHISAEYGITIREIKAEERR